MRRDIRIMAEELSLSFEEKQEPSTGGRPSKLFLLPKRETLILVSGYSVTMRAKIIDRWQELEAQVAAPMIPTTVTGALVVAQNCTANGNALWVRPVYGLLRLAGRVPLSL